MIEVSRLEDGKFKMILDYDNMMLLKEFYRQIALNGETLNEDSSESIGNEVESFIDEMTKNYLAIVEAEK